MSGLFNFRFVANMALFWLPICLAAGLAYIVYQDGRLGYQSIAASHTDPVLVEVGPQDPAAYYLQARLVPIGEQILLRNDGNIAISRNADVVTLAAHPANMLAGDSSPPLFISNHLVQTYQASVGFYGIPIQISSVLTGFVSVWLLLLAGSFHLIVSRRRHDVVRWTRSSEEMQELYQLMKQGGNQAAVRKQNILATKGLVCLFLLPTMGLLLFLSVLYLVFISFLALPEPAENGSLMAGAIIFLGLAFITLLTSSLRKALPRPSGLKVSGHHVPDLQQEIDRLCRELHLPRISHIIVTEHYELDLSLYISPHGLPIPRISMAIGLPLLQSLSPEEFLARLSGELAKYSNRNGRLSSLFSLGRTLWKRYRKQHIGRMKSHNALVMAMLAPIRPYLNALCLSLLTSRKQQVADFAVQKTDVKTTTSSIIRSHFSQRLFERRFWDEFYQGAYKNTYPKTMPFDLTQSYFSSDQVKQIQESFYQESFQSQQSDLHQNRLNICLSDLGLLPTSPGRLNQSAAEGFLGAEESAIREALNIQWWQRNSDLWHACHDHFRNLANRQGKLDQLFEKGELTEEAWLDWAEVTHHLDGVDAAIDCYEALLTIYPQNIRANYHAGWHRLQRGDTSGLQMLDIVAEGDPELAEDVCRDALSWLKSENRKELIPYWQQKLDNKCNLNHLNSKERSTILDSDSLIEHDLGTQNMKDLIHAIEKVPEVEQAFLARKRVTARPNAPLYVLGVQGLKSHHFLRGIDPLEMLLEKLDLQFDTFVVPLNNNFKKLQRQFETMENALIFNRSGQGNQLAGDR